MQIEHNTIIFLLRIIDLEKSVDQLILSILYTCQKIDPAGTLSVCNIIVPFCPPRKLPSSHYSRCSTINNVSQGSSLRAALSSCASISLHSSFQGCFCHPLVSKVSLLLLSRFFSSSRMISLDQAQNYFNEIGTEKGIVNPEEKKRKNSFLI